MIKSDSNTYKFTVDTDKSIEVFVGDNTIEIYEENNPSNTGFVFYRMSDFIYFCNCITDIIEEKQKDK